VEAGAHIDPSGREDLSNCECATHRPSWSIEGGEEAIPRRVNLSSAELLEDFANIAMMQPQEVPPACIA